MHNNIRQIVLAQINLPVSPPFEAYLPLLLQEATA